jgi:serine/threonine protein kinase
MKRQKDCLKNYELHQLIGRGAFGDVRIAKNKATSNL